METGLILLPGSFLKTFDVNTKNTNHFISIVSSL